MKSVVQLRQNDQIYIVKMEDRESRNSFSPELVQGLKKTFCEINASENVKAVVIFGYDNYFCCGGTKEELLGILENKYNFSDETIYDLLLKCKVPVIAAMQGHAIGGGLAFGCFADMVVMAKEAIYSAAFMKYGFTPGFGSTYIIPKRFGDHLGYELLYTARNFYGSELLERGVPMKVVRKGEVIPTAMEMAHELADKSLLSLKLLKQSLTHQIVQELPKAIENEIHMHKLSFAQPVVRERIERVFAKNVFQD